MFLPIIMGTSRTSKAIKNSVVSLTFYFVSIVVQFVARKVFLEYLGTEILGLNTTAQNILQFLNLAELGIASAAGYFLYKPLREGDRDSINEIISLQGHLYRRIAFLIIGGAVMVMPFFPLIFAKIKLSLWYAYVSFGVYLFGALLGYFVNYRQIVLTANQQNYKVQYSYQSVMILRSVAQIIAMKLFPDPFLWWAGLYVVFTVIGSGSLHWMTKRTAPYLVKSTLTFKQLRAKYPEFTVKIKQLFFHKIGQFVLTQTSTLVIYAYASLTMVAFYGNYMMVVTGVLMMIAALFNSIDAGIGNLVAEGDMAKIMKVFKEMFSLRFTISITMAFMVFMLTPQFISIWIGSQYLLPIPTLALITAIMYIQLNRLSVDAFISANGLFQDIWSPVAEAALNLGLSILLGYFYGLNGILTGVLLSLVLVIASWKPYFLFSRGFKKSIWIYVRLYLHHILAGAAAWGATMWLANIMGLEALPTVGSLVTNALTYFVSFVFILGAILYLTNAGIKATVHRFL